MKPGRIVAIDHGTRRSGVAFSDGSRTFAFPGEVFEREEDVFAYLRDLAARDGLAAVVIGLPLNMDGTEGPRAADVRAFGERLQARVAVEVIWWDERLTSVEAAELLRGVRPRGGRVPLDAVAAQLILRSYLASIHESG